MEYTILILILPLLSFLCLGLLGTKLRPFVSGCIGSIVLAAVAAMSYTVAAQYFSTARVDGIYQPWTVFNVEWLGFTQNLHIDLGILLDPISVMMLVVISTVSLMVHIYSLGYMKGEVGFQRYYAARGDRRIEKGFYRDAIRRYVLPDRYPALIVLYPDIQLRGNYLERSR